MSWQAKLATVLVGNLYRVVLSRLHEESSFKKCARYSRLYPSRHLSEACGNTTREGSFLPSSCNYAKRRAFLQHVPGAGIATLGNFFTKYFTCAPASISFTFHCPQHPN